MGPCGGGGAEGARRCTMNAVAGREAEFSELKPARVKKKVMVGGGALLPVASPPRKEKIEVFRKYMERQVARAGASIELGTEVTRDLVEKEHPDAVVLAAGARP